MGKKIVLIGGGGHCKSVIDTIIQCYNYDIVGITDLETEIGKKISEISIIGTDNDLEKIFNLGVENAIISLGSIGDSSLRVKLYKYAKKIGFSFPKIIDKTAIISKRSLISEGTFIGKGVIVNTDVSIGKNCIINSGSVVEHECEIHDYVHIAPGSVLSGNVTIGSHSHVGTNSTIIQNINIGENCIIGSGSNVIRDIGNNFLVYGNPSEIIKELK